MLHGKCNVALARHGKPGHRPVGCIQNANLSVRVPTDKPRIKRNVFLSATAAPPAPTQQPIGHTQLQHGLGSVGDVAPTHLPWLLRLAHTKARHYGGDSTQALQESARGLQAWRAALDRGLLPDDMALQQIVASGEEAFTAGRSAEELKWPEEPLNTMMVRLFSKLGAARFARKYPAVKDALLKSVLEATVKYHRAVAGEKDEEEEAGEVDSNGNRGKTAAQLAREEAERRAARGGGGHMSAAMQATMDAVAAKRMEAERRAARAAQDAALPANKRIAVEIARDLYAQWTAPLAALSRAGAAFEGLEALLGGGEFSLGGNIWKRAGWGQLDELRRKLEDLKELRDLVRSLGRGGGWGPLRRAPVQHLDMSGRPGLMRTVLEAQETRGLCRSGDISRLLPAEAALIARGRTVRAAKLLFYARLAEKGLQTYERDGWGEFPTRVVPDRREVRPTADRGPILLCVDTSGSMRGAREAIAKALALECMRAAREQERACYVFAFSGPAEVRELELNNDMKSVNNLLDFLEKVFNGGSDFNEPVKRCLDRLTDAKWANSDILLVSDGELRQPAPEVMRKLAGAKDKLSLRVHGLVVGSPDKKRADPAVLRGLCTAVLPNGKVEVLVSEFSSWSSVKADSELGAIDFDDAEGNARRRLAGLAHEKARQEETRRRRREQRGGGGGGSASDPTRRMPTDGSGRKAAAAATAAAGGKKH
uniref:VWFA domain-containing protein n=1 Tax=Chlamydomonas leiostraca TaxID=1034604 RepID=A0A7S0RJC1_9CHLO|mmetsp:Transcript_24600/g.62491  ORF Transcript_24600/g.62491 Transcript_24600/m.62491 type:complete len:709 (+) Transcript_24600:100-2226(+)